MKFEVVVCQTGMGRHDPHLPGKIHGRGGRLGTVECFDKCEICEFFLIARIDGVTTRFKTSHELCSALDTLHPEEP